jgi:hypothetical protein
VPQPTAAPRSLKIICGDEDDDNDDDDNKGKGKVVPFQA